MEAKVEGRRVAPVKERGIRLTGTLEVGGLVLTELVFVPGAKAPKADGYVAWPGTPANMYLSLRDDLGREIMVSFDQNSLKVGYPPSGAPLQVGEEGEGEEGVG